TPVDGNHNPDLSYLEAASQTVGSVIKRGDVVVFESTVYPGTTEDFCIPIIERVSGLVCNLDFTAGYSPERINPGDREHTVRNICKIVSGSTPEAAERINRVYSSVLTGGTHLASSIKVAEAAKIIENTQRDVNIAFINEVTKVLNSLNINTDRVLEAASTKWNFLKFHPGLVGGHCISVDPYYLIRQAERHGEHPHLMKEARRINESMGFYLAENVVKTIRERGKEPSEMRILVLGFSFKANCPDIRNTKVYDTIMRLLEYTPHVIAYDPVVNIDTVRHEYGDVPVSTDFKEIVAAGSFDVVVRCVNHSCFSRLDLRSVTRRGFIEQAIVNPDL
ncbi:MAG: nucleotide sugar dehydrogenase, partial [Muribaculaceae bacterium]